MANFFIGKDVAGRVGGARHTDKTNIITHFKVIKVHVVFKHAIIKLPNFRFACYKMVLVQSAVAVSDIFRCQRKQHFLSATALEVTGHQVKQVEKGCLAAIGQGDILGAYLPAQLFGQQLGQCLNKAVLALRAIVIGYGFQQVTGF